MSFRTVTMLPEPPRLRCRECGGALIAHPDTDLGELCDCDELPERRDFPEEPSMFLRPQAD